MTKMCSHTLHYCIRREMQPHRMARNPSKHHWAVVFREVALLWSTINEIDLKMGYYLASRPGFKIKWIWLRFGGFLVTLSPNPAPAKTFPELFSFPSYTPTPTKNTVWILRQLPCKSVCSLTCISVKICVWECELALVYDHTGCLWHSQVCNYSCPPWSHIRTMMGHLLRAVYWVMVWRNKGGDVVFFARCTSNTLQETYLNLTSGPVIPHTRTQVLLKRGFVFLSSLLHLWDLT